MIDNVNQILGAVAGSEIGKTARRSARTVWKAHVAALETTREEAAKVLGVALTEGQKIDVQSRKTIGGAVESLTGVAVERLSALERAFQSRVERVIRRMGVPTARDVASLSRRVDAISARVKSRGAREAPRRRTRRAAA